MAWGLREKEVEHSVEAWGSPSPQGVKTKEDLKEGQQELAKPRSEGLWMGDYRYHDEVFVAEMPSKMRTKNIYLLAL